MATTKIWPVKDSLKRLVDYAVNPEKTANDDLEAVIRYAMNGHKTSDKNEKACFVTGVNCIADTALDEMLSTQKHFGKTGGNVAYHCYQSFKPGEVTPGQCHQLGVELAHRMWGDKYHVLVATHLDRDHLHNHLVCCSVSFIDGRKFNDNKGAYARLRQLSDEICLENGLSVIDKPKGRTPRQLHFAEKKGEPTKYNLMRKAIDDAIPLCANIPSFIDLMRQQGYIIDYSRTRKYPTIRSINSEKSTRMYHLGSEYELERIDQRIRENSIDLVIRNREEFRSPYKHPRKTRIRVNGTRTSAKKIGGIYGLYLHYLYLLGYRPKGKHRPLSPEMREACRRCDEYSRQARLMARHHLRTEDDVTAFIAQVDERMNELTAERDSIYNKLRRCKDPEVTSQLKSRRDSITIELKEIRGERRDAVNILERTDEIRRTVAIEQYAMQGKDLSRTRVNKSRDLER